MHCSKTSYQYSLTCRLWIVGVNACLNLNRLYVHVYGSRRCCGKQALSSLLRHSLPDINKLNCWHKYQQTHSCSHTCHKHTHIPTIVNAYERVAYVAAYLPKDFAFNLLKEWTKEEEIKVALQYGMFSIFFLCQCPTFCQLGVFERCVWFKIILIIIYCLVLDEGKKE